VRLRQHRLQRREVEARRAIGRDAEDAALLAAEREALDVEEAGRPLEVGQRLGRNGAEPQELGPARDLEPEHVDELRIMPLQDPEEIDDLPVDVVHDLGRRLGRAAEEDAAHAHEGLGVGAMGDARDPLGQRGRKPVLSAEPGRDRLDRGNGRQHDGKGLPAISARPLGGRAAERV